MVRGIRGAITIEEDRVDEITRATQELLEAIVVYNGLELSDIVSANFSATADIRSLYPAQAAREMGWKYVPLMCSQEMSVEGSLPLCIRVLVLVNTAKPAEMMRHVYLRKASGLREDLELPIKL